MWSTPCFTIKPNHALKEPEIPIISGSVKAHAKAIRSVSLLKLKAQCAFNASSAASALHARALHTTQVHKTEELCALLCTYTHCKYTNTRNYARICVHTHHPSTQNRGTMRAFVYLHTTQVHKRREFSGKCCQNLPKRQQTPGNFRVHIWYNVKTCA